MNQGMNETIAAIASGFGNAGIGIVRISGKDAFFIADQIFEGKNHKKICDSKSHRIHYGTIVDNGKVIDEVLLLVMRGPKSYTAEDTVEIDCHGGNLVTKKILETVLKYGARPAQPGEFTKRAFLNGRMDLSQSEAVIDVINAQNQLALESSIRQLKGSLTDLIKGMREKIIYEIAFIESALDDPEHISLEGYGEKLAGIVDDLLVETDKLLKTSSHGKLLKEGINTVIAGKPNAGKSSLMNLLAGEEKAIVTEIAGTTRDALEEQVLLGGLQLNIIDTAGIRSTEDVVEKIGVDRARKYVEKADLVIYVVDSSVPLDENDASIIELLQDKQVIVLMNKTDLKQAVTKEDIEKILPKTILSVSAREETGMDQLEDAIKEMFFQGEISFNNEVYLTNARHKQEMLNCRQSLRLVKKSIEEGMPEDFFSIDLMNAYEALGNIIGEAVEEDLVNTIFSEFCTGK